MILARSLERASKLRKAGDVLLENRKSPLRGRRRVGQYEAQAGLAHGHPNDPEILAARPRSAAVTDRVAFDQPLDYFSREIAQRLPPAEWLRPIVLPFCSRDPRTRRASRAIHESKQSDVISARAPTRFRRLYPQRANISLPLIAAIAGISLACPALASPAGPSGFFPVSLVKITPSPFHMDEPTMRVSFNAVVPAPAGYRYFASWQSQAPRSTQPGGCSPSSDIAVKGAIGGSANTVLVLRPEPLFGDAFCPGRSSVAIVLQRARPDGRVAAGAGASTLRTLIHYSFRVLRP